MARWQKHARIGLALFGVAFAVVVFATMRQREPVAPLDRPARLDPKAILESAGAAFRQFREAKQDFSIEAERQLTYEGGATRFIGVTISVRNRGGRDFSVSGREAEAGENREELEVSGDVKLTASDGFTVTADTATFREADATVRIPGPVAFQKGAMSGSGRGMTYNQTADVLSLAEEARVRVTDERGAAQTEFESSTATLARREKYLSLEGNVHALRSGQVLEAERGVARLTEDEERITFIELRGQARVTGGTAFESMSARDIDLDYADDGTTLERVALRGNAGVLLAGSDEGSVGRQFFGDSLDLTFAPDASLTAATGAGGVRVNLPPTGGGPSRSVTAEAFEAAGETGTGLTSVRFTGSVAYAEGANGNQPARSATSASLQLGLSGDAVTQALFAGRVRFEQENLQASGAQAEYEPTKGTLRLTGADAGGGPHVANPDIDIEAQTINLTLEGMRVVASGAVRTILRQAATQPGAAATGKPETRLPGLLAQAEPVNVTANGLDYDDASGKAAYSGNAALWQGETAVRGNTLVLDRSRGDFVATGDARSNIVLDSGASVGRAAEIRYEDTARRLTYAAAPPVAAPAPARGREGAPNVGAPGVVPTPALPPPPPPPLAQLSGPQGDLRGRRIEVFLAKTASQLERLEAYTEVTLRLERRVATGDRLTHYAADERYEMTGIATVPVRIVEECRQTSGRTVTFFKTGDRIIVDGKEEVRTQSSRSGPCAEAPAR